MDPVVPFERSTVFFDGLFSEPRLNHPEGLAIDAAGDVWCGGEEGEIYRIAADGSAIELMASTGGFTLGLAFDHHDGRVDQQLDDPEAHTLCHPTNCAFRGRELFSSNLGRWHITRTDVGAEGLPVP